MQNENLKPAPASTSTTWLASLDQPIKHPPHIQEFLERNRRDLLCAPLVFKPEEISGRLLDTKAGPGLRINLQNTELDKRYKNPRPPIAVEATLAEWQAEFRLTPRLLLKLRPFLQQQAPALLANAPTFEELGSPYVPEPHGNGYCLVADVLYSCAIKTDGSFELEEGGAAINWYQVYDRSDEENDELRPVVQAMGGEWATIAANFCR
jgi:hypothetical protein